jgi:hypothetical protein
MAIMNVSLNELFSNFNTKTSFIYQIINALNQSLKNFFYNDLYENKITMGKSIYFNKNINSNKLSHLNFMERGESSTQNKEIKENNFLPEKEIKGELVPINKEIKGELLPVNSEIKGELLPINSNNMPTNNVSSLITENLSTNQSIQVNINITGSNNTINIPEINKSTIFKLDNKSETNFNEDSNANLNYNYSDSNSLNLDEMKIDFIMKDMLNNNIKFIKEGNKLLENNKKIIKESKELLNSNENLIKLSKELLESNKEIDRINNEISKSKSLVLQVTKEVEESNKRAGSFKTEILESRKKPKVTDNK